MKALMPGSFDPITHGHLDVITQASSLFDRVIVLVAVNSSKTPMFDMDDRVEMVERCTRHLHNVQVLASGGKLTAKVAMELDCTAIVRSMRLSTEYEKELEQAMINRELGKGMPTLLICPKQEHLHISSSAARVILSVEGPGSFDLLRMVPDQALDVIRGGDPA